MEALTLSRQDNPYLMHQLEKLSVAGDLKAEISLSALSSPGKSCLATDEQNKCDVSISMDIEEILEEESLHDKLIRSPPPNFPKKLSCFIYPPESIVGSVHTCDSPSHQFLSPINSRMAKVKNIENLQKQLKTNYSDKNLRERRGSDGSLSMIHYWKNTLSNPALMTASSSSIFSFNDDVNPVTFTNPNYNNTELIQNTNDDISQYNADNLLFVSPSNSSEALLKQNPNRIN